MKRSRTCGSVESFVDIHVVILIPLISLSTAVCKYSEILTYLSLYVVLPPKSAGFTVGSLHITFFNFPYLTGNVISVT
jgi:hypothetical protein